MPATTTRAYLVIGFGLLLGAALVGSALRGLWRQVGAAPSPGPWHVSLLVSAQYARLVLGASVIGLALFLWAGQTLWTTQAPAAWASSVGLALLALCLGSGAIVGSLTLMLRQRPIH